MANWKKYEKRMIQDLGEIPDTNITQLNSTQIGSQNPDAIVKYKGYTFIFDAKYYLKGTIQSSTLTKMVTYRNQFQAHGCALVLPIGTDVTDGMQVSAAAHKVEILRRNANTQFFANADENFKNQAIVWMDNFIQIDQAKTKEQKKIELYDTISEKLLEIQDVINNSGIANDDLIDTNIKEKLLLDLTAFLTNNQNLLDPAEE
jgi:hypothetical protein